MENEIDIHRRIIQYSALTLLSAMMAPISIVLMAQRNFPWALNFVVFYSFCILAFFLQRKRMKLSKQLSKKPPLLAIGDEVYWPEKNSEFVVIKYGFNHYYLKSLDSDQVYLVNQRKIEKSRKIVS